MGKRWLFFRKSVESTPDEQHLYGELQMLAQELTPDDAFKETLAQQLLNAKPPLNTIYPDFGDNASLAQLPPHSNTFLRGKLRLVVALIASVILILTLTLFVPPLRTFATDILDVILNRTSTDLIVFEYYEPDRLVNQFPLLADQYIFFSTVASVEYYVDYAVLEPHAILELPPREIVYIDNRNMVSLVYSYPNGGWLEIQQQPVADMLYWRNVVGASANVTHVNLQRGDEHLAGEYVQGWWYISDSSDIENPSLGVAEWVDDVPVRRLRWFENEMVYEIQIWEGMPRTPDIIPLEEMIQIAESLR